MEGLGHHTRKIIEDILDATCDYFNINLKFLKKRTRRRAHVRPRHIAIYLISRETELTLSEIGKLFGYHHTTILNAIQTVEDKIKNDESYAQEVESVWKIVKLEPLD